MAEEQRCQEGHRLCANNCGLFGSPATRDLCSKCYVDFRLKHEQAVLPPPAAAPSLSSSAFSPFSSTSSSSFHVAAVGEATECTTPRAAAVKPAARRCESCRKRVGLTGFACRCGSTFCGTHRYPENHACTFDFKAAGRDAIVRANPVIKADKLHHKI